MERDPLHGPSLHGLGGETTLEVIAPMASFYFTKRTNRAGGELAATHVSHQFRGVQLGDPLGCDDGFEAEGEVDLLRFDVLAIFSNHRHGGDSARGPIRRVRGRRNSFEP